MDSAPLLLALGAGALAALNPCGFALLPAWLTLLVDRDTRTRSDAVVRSLALSAAMTTGFVAVFGLFGAVVVPLALSLKQYLPWATIVIGAVLVGLGVVLLSGRDVVLTIPHWRRVPACVAGGRWPPTERPTPWPRSPARSGRSSPSWRRPAEPTAWPPGWPSSSRMR